MWTQLATRRDSFVLSWPSFQFATFSLKYIEDYWKLGNWNGNWVETRQNCLALSAVVFTPPTRTRQPCPQCEQGITQNCQLFMMMWKCLGKYLAHVAPCFIYLSILLQLFSDCSFRCFTRTYTGHCLSVQQDWSQKCVIQLIPSKRLPAALSQLSTFWSVNLVIKKNKRKFIP